MDTLFLYNTKTLKEKFNTKVFAGDNNITKINVQIPDNIGGYPKRECEFNLRAIIPEGNLSYIINPNEPYFYITNDITEKAQTVKLMMIITHEGNVIGRTNTVDLVVNEPAEAPDPPLTPREQFDEVIAEQRAEIAEQAETISTQGETITQQTEQITELSGEVSTLEGTVAEQQATITRQNTTIDELNERRIPVYIKPDLQSRQVTPSWQNQYIEPDSGKDGLSSVTVNAITAELVPNLEPQNIAKNKVVGGVTGTFDSFPENPVGGIYFYEPDGNGNPTKCKVYNYNTVPSLSFPTWFFSGNKMPYVKEIEFVNSNFYALDASCFNQCPNLVFVNLGNNIITIGRQAFYECTNLVSVNLGNVVTTINAVAFYGCTSLKTIHFPNTITSIDTNLAFYGCTSLEYVTIENGFNCNNLNLSSSTLYSVETIVSWLEALADRTGETAYTLTIDTTNINKLTAEQRAIATNKNWNLA